MAEWIFRREQGGCAWLGRGPGKRSERRSSHKAICPNGMLEGRSVPSRKVSGYYPADAPCAASRLVSKSRLRVTMGWEGEADGSSVVHHNRDLKSNGEKIESDLESLPFERGFDADFVLNGARLFAFQAASRGDTRSAVIPVRQTIRRRIVPSLSTKPETMNDASTNGQIPALLTNTSIRSYLATAWATMCSTESRSETSHAMPKAARAPLRRTRPAASTAAVRSRSAITIFAFFAAKHSAVPNPERRSVSPDFILAFAVSIGIILTMGAQLQTGRLGEWSGHLKSGG